MSSSALHLVLLVIVFVLIETAEQTLYRLAGRDKSRWWFYIVPAVTMHLINLAIWYLLLRIAPLAVALPLIGLQYVTITLAAQFIFRERVDARRWFGITVIAIGFALVAGYSNV